MFSAFGMIYGCSRWEWIRLTDILLNIKFWFISLRRFHFYLDMVTHQIITLFISVVFKWTVISNNWFSVLCLLHFHLHLFSFCQLSSRHWFSKHLHSLLLMFITNILFSRFHWIIDFGFNALKSFHFPVVRLFVFLLFSFLINFTLLGSNLAKVVLMVVFGENFASSWMKHFTHSVGIIMIIVS